MDSTAAATYVSWSSQYCCVRIAALSRPDWSRPLPRPLTIPTVIKLSTLADVRDLVYKHLLEQYRRKAAWRHVSTELVKAADGEKDLPEICVSLRLVLALEGVECLMK
jgi:hypothetical protein